MLSLLAPSCSVSWHIVSGWVWACCFSTPFIRRSPKSMPSYGPLFKLMNILSFDSFILYQHKWGFSWRYLCIYILSFMSVFTLHTNKGTVCSCVWKCLCVDVMWPIIFSLCVWTWATICQGNWVMIPPPFLFLSSLYAKPLSAHASLYVIRPADS